MKCSTGWKIEMSEIFLELLIVKYLQKYFIDL